MNKSEMERRDQVLRAYFEGRDWDELYIVGPPADHTGQPSKHPSLQGHLGIYRREHPKSSEPEQ